MRILSFGSLNLDKVYHIPHFLRPGETMAAADMESFPGGKGLNQSIALSKAGAQVFHAGCVGEKDGQLLLDTLNQAGVDTSLVRQLPCPTGHAVIQVNSQGQNSILLFGGANQEITKEQVDSTLRIFGKDDILVLQNEINLLPYIMEQAGKKGMAIVFNPSPMTPELLELPLENVDYFLLNEIEAKDLCGHEVPAAEYPQLMLQKFPGSHIILTLGSQGCIYQDAQQQIIHPACRVKAIDTTAAGDTFTGYFVAAIARNAALTTALDEATRAAAIAVSRPGAAPSIPTRDELLMQKSAL